MAAPVVLAQALLAGAHLALPWMLRSVPGRYRGQAQACYDGATVVIAALCVLAACIPRTGWAPVVPVAGVWTTYPGAAVLGLAVPVAAAKLARRPLRRRRPPRIGVADAAILLACAVAEEIIWRAMAPALLAAVGLPMWSAMLVSGALFASLHVPRSGFRSLPYHVTLAYIFVAVAVTGGLVAAMLCHIAHNAVLAAATPSPPGSHCEARRPRPSTAPVDPPPALPQAQAWD